MKRVGPEEDAGVIAHIRVDAIQSASLQSVSGQPIPIFTRVDLTASLNRTIIPYPWLRICRTHRSPDRFVAKKNTNAHGIVRVRLQQIVDPNFWLIISSCESSNGFSKKPLSFAPISGTKSSIAWIRNWKKSFSKVPALRRLMPAVGTSSSSRFGTWIRGTRDLLQSFNHTKEKKMSIFNSDGTLNFDVEVLKATIFQQEEDSEPPRA